MYAFAQNKGKKRACVKGSPPSFREIIIIEEYFEFKIESLLRSIYRIICMQMVSIEINMRQSLRQRLCTALLHRLRGSRLRSDLRHTGLRLF